MEDFTGRLGYLVNEFAAGKHSVFAKQAGIKAPTFQNYINGRTPSAETLKIIHNYYGVDLNWLISGEGRPILPHKVSVMRFNESSSPGKVFDHIRSILHLIRKGVEVYYDYIHGKKSFAYLVEFVGGETQFIYDENVSLTDVRYKKELNRIKNIFSANEIHLGSISVNFEEMSELYKDNNVEERKKLLARGKPVLLGNGSLVMDDGDVGGEDELTEIYRLIKMHASHNFLKMLKNKLLELKKIEKQF